MFIIFYYLSGVIFFFFSLLMLIFSLLFILNDMNYFVEWYLFNLNSVYLNMLIYIDWMALIFMFTVLLISAMIMFYCCEYMDSDLYKIRFFFLVFFFIISMLFMIISPNMVSIILGWDGLGLVSYCLVIYYQNYYSFNSGMLTVLMNRIGDILIMLSISMMMIFGSWNLMNLNNYLYMLLLIMLMFTAFTKSAQLPFSSWLPAAMAAPTPVSSLVHSSTLVTAGIYLLIRFNYIIYKNEMILFLLVVIGMLTMMMAGLCANFEYDFKKIIAYSTLSQLGLMVVIYGMKFYLLCFFHLIIHAMFKSMMFMCSGIIIHSMNNVQDIRFLGNLNEFLPFTMMMFMISNFSLCGVPFMSGFFSKDMILEMVFMSKFTLLLFIYLVFSTMLTVVYSIRLLYYLINKKFNFMAYLNIKEFKLMNYPMLLLMINSIYMGFIFNWLIYLHIEEIYLMMMEKILILILCIISIYFGKNVYLTKFNSNKNWFYFFGKMSYLYYMNMFIYKYNLNLMKFYYFLMDKGMMNYLFENSLFKILNGVKFNILNYSNLIMLMLMISNLFIYIFMI